MRLLFIRCDCLRDDRQQSARALMRSPVRLQIGYAGEAFVASLAFESFHAGVHRPVRDQTLTMGERFVARVAFVGLFAAVSTRVHLQLPFVAEQFAANLARMRQCARVYEPMRLQGAGAVIEFTAIVAFVAWRSATVGLRVIVEHANAREHFATSWTGEARFRMVLLFVDEFRVVAQHIDVFVSFQANLARQLLIVFGAFVRFHCVDVREIQRTTGAFGCQAAIRSWSRGKYFIQQLNG